MNRILLIISIFAFTGVAKGYVSDDFLSTVLFRTIEMYKDCHQDAECQDDAVGMIDVRGLATYIDSYALPGAKDDGYVDIPDSLLETVRLITLCTDMSPRGIYIKALDYALLNNNIDIADEYYEDNQRGSRLNKIHRSSLPYLSAWLKDNGMFITDGIISDYLSYRIEQDSLLKLASGNDDLLAKLLFYDTYTLDSDDIQSFVESYCRNYDRAIELRRRFFERKYGGEPEP